MPISDIHVRIVFVPIENIAEIPLVDSHNTPDLVGFLVNCAIEGTSAEVRSWELRTKGALMSEVEVDQVTDLIEEHTVWKGMASGVLEEFPELTDTYHRAVSRALLDECITAREAIRIQLSPAV